LEIATLKNLNKRRWNRIVAKSENATVFHSLKWLTIQKKIFSLEEMLLYSETCIFPIFIKRKGPFKIYGSPVPETGAFYGGPICLNREGYIDALNHFKNLSAFSALFIKTPNNFNISIFKDGYKIEPVGNFIVDLKKTEDELWMNLNKKTRNAVRKAEKSGVKVEFCDSSYLDEYYKMVEEVARRSSIVPLPKEFMKEVIESGLGKLILAFYRDQPAAGGIFLTFKDTVTYWDGASHYKFRIYQPSNLLQWELIKWAREKYSYYDLGGAGIPRITRFKKGWGGKYVEYYRVYKEGPLARAARIAYRKLRYYPWVSRIFRS
jgi:lipid II:glycine glycyltransferase (peptidoglycan interpeptide bridge formation enzyme)